MINNVKKAIVNKLVELYPFHTNYDEDVPKNFKTPSFMITLIDQDYNKRLSNRFSSVLSFDIAYFSDKTKEEIKNDCYSVQMNLLRNFDIIGTHRVIEKQSTITDNVLHFTFNVNCSEMLAEQFEKMQDIEDVNTNI